MTSSRNQAESLQHPAEFELEHFLPYRLSLLTNTISQGIANSYRREHDISVTEWRVMAVLGRYAGLTASEVVERTAMDKVAISRAVKSLVLKGLLERRTDKGDRRRLRLFISRNQGQKVLEKIVPLAQKYEQLLLRSLTAEELQTTDKVVSILLDSARKMGVKRN